MKLEVCDMSGNKKKNIVATIMGKVALNSAKAADRDQEDFPIRKLHTEKCCHMCEETCIYGSFFGKEVQPIHFERNELKNIQ